ncbi:hypothetical protein GCM10023184_29030 [Flaviaesturariibacter amylovorans]|uniref:Response regulatory domain-containing protein n=2 Tax=Flaviaesturariibacter amylovorans TaxID=1084520 RepID=A0ABP8H5V4_9BACT
MNLPGMTGAQLKAVINNDKRLLRKSIPFVFLTTSTHSDEVLQAYENLAQGYFTKPLTFANFCEMVDMILRYWKIARHPDANLLH